MHPELPQSEPVSTVNTSSLITDAGVTPPPVAFTVPEISQTEGEGRQIRRQSHGNEGIQVSKLQSESQSALLHREESLRFIGSNSAEDKVGVPQPQQTTSRRPSSMSSDSFKSDINDSSSFSNNTMRPARAHAPRLTVNSKEMISGDSFWAMELQRVLQSASPTSQMESRLSGDWAAVKVTGDL